MIYCAANHAKVWRLRRDGWHQLGWCMSPDGYRSPIRGNEAVPFILDNGLFHQPGSEPKPASMRANIIELAARCVRLGHSHLCFGLVVPDVPYDGKASKAVSDEWLPVVRKVVPGIRALIAVQDGMCWDDVDGYDGVFVAGSTEWKEQTMDYWCGNARRDRLWAHVGRVNGPDRLLRCMSAGAHSADGTCFGRGDKTQLKKLMDALVQMPMPFASFENTASTQPIGSAPSKANARESMATPTTFGLSLPAGTTPAEDTA